MQSVGIVRTGGASLLVKFHGELISAIKLTPNYNFSFAGSLMIIAWIGFTSIAILMARHYRQDWENRTLCGVKIWFAVSDNQFCANVSCLNSYFVFCSFIVVS